MPLDEPQQDNTLRGMLMKRKAETCSTENTANKIYKEFEQAPPKRFMKMRSNFAESLHAKMKKQHAVGDMARYDEAIDHLKTQVPASSRHAEMAA
jgi:hypothetical protein